MSRVILSRDLAADGFSPGELARTTRSGELTRLRRGSYAKRTEPEPDPRGAHLRLLEATLPQCDPSAVASHTSAAAVHDLPVWQERLERVHLTRNRRGGGRTRRWVQVHGAPLADDEVTSVDGFQVTGLPRTVVDLGRSLPLAEAVAAGDDALFRLRPGELEEALDRQAGCTGIGQARRVVGLLDARSESAGESYSRVVFHLAGLPSPEPQYRVLTADRRLVGRCDFGWPEFGVLAEFDGKKKYGRLLRKLGQTARTC